MQWQCLRCHVEVECKQASMWNRATHMLFTPQVAAEEACSRGRYWGHLHTNLSVVIDIPRRYAVWQIFTSVNNRFIPDLSWEHEYLHDYQSRAVWLTENIWWSSSVNTLGSKSFSRNSKSILRIYDCLKYNFCGYFLYLSLYVWA